MSSGTSGLITVALVDDDDVVVVGVANILGQHADRVVIAEISTNKPWSTKSTSSCTTRSLTG